jgi:hypothetical protein
MSTLWLVLLGGLGIGTLVSVVLGRPLTPWSRFRDPLWVRGYGSFVLLFGGGALVLEHSHALALAVGLFSVAAVSLLATVIVDYNRRHPI